MTLIESRLNMYFRIIVLWKTVFDQIKLSLKIKKGASSDQEVKNSVFFDMKNKFQYPLIRDKEGNIRIDWYVYEIGGF